MLTLPEGGMSHLQDNCALTDCTLQGTGTARKEKLVAADSLLL